MPELTSVKDILGHALGLAEWFIVAVVFKFIILKWVADKTKVIFKWIFIRTEKDLATWIHFRNKAMNKGHQHVKQADCEDGLCEIS